MPAPKVSVLLPVWNAERFLARAMESVLGQTFTSLELIVIDDGSTDGSAGIAQGFADHDSRVVVLLREHEGFARSLNAGIAVARGRYIARMDGDDVALRSRLEKQVAYLDENEGCVAVGAWVEVIDEDDRHIGFQTFVSEHDEIATALIGGSSPLSHPTIVVRAEALQAAGGYATDRYPSEDFDLWLKLSELGELANVREPLLQYRRHRGAVGVREKRRQLVIGTEIVDAARKRKKMGPLRRRLLSTGRNAAARYHSECARIALAGGPRRAAMRHAWKSIVSEPQWPYPYAILLACAVPKRTLRVIATLYRQFLSSRR